MSHPEHCHIWEAELCDPVERCAVCPAVRLPCEAGRHVWEAHLEDAWERCVNCPQVRPLHTFLGRWGPSD